MSLSYDEALPPSPVRARPSSSSTRWSTGPATACSSTPRPPSARCSPEPGVRTSTFLVYEDERWSFDETMGHVDALAHALVHRFGIGKGDRVGIAMRNLPEWIVSFAAILSIGAVSVSLNAWWTETEVDYAIGDSGLSLLIADPERIERAHDAAHRPGDPDDRGAGRRHRARADRRPSLRRRHHPRATPCPTSRWTRPTTPPSSTPREPPGSPRGRCRPTGP